MLKSKLLLGKQSSWASGSLFTQNFSCTSYSSLSGQYTHLLYFFDVGQTNLQSTGVSMALSQDYDLWQFFKSIFQIMYGCVENCKTIQKLDLVVCGNDELKSFLFQRGNFSHFAGTENGTSGAQIKIPRPLFNTKQPQKATSGTKIGLHFSFCTSVFFFLIVLTPCHISLVSNLLQHSSLNLAPNIKFVVDKKLVVSE